MRRIFNLSIIALAAMFAACTELELSPVQDTATDAPEFIACIDDAGLTKTAIDGFKVQWLAGDEISVNGKKYVAEPYESDPRTAKFTLKEGETAPTGTTFRAAYPASNYNSTAGRYTFGAATLSSKTDGSDLNPMYAVADEDGVLHFKNVGATLALDLKGNYSIKSIKLTAPNRKYIRGNLTNVAISEEGVLTYTAPSSGGTNFTTNYANPVELKEDVATRLYFYVPEGTYSSLSFQITDSYGRTKTLASSKELDLKKNMLYNVPADVTVPVLDFKAELKIDKVETVSPSSVDLAVSIVPEDKDVYYITAVESASYVSQFEDELELAIADIVYWKGQGASSLSVLVSAGLAMKGDDLNDTQYSSCRPNNDYVFYAYAVDADLNVSKAITVPFHTPEYVRPACNAKYEDYLGQWTLGTNLITIAEKEAGKTYAVSGLLYQSYPSFGYEFAPVEAQFDNGYFLLNEQKTGTVVSVGSYGPCDIVLTGEFVSGGSKYKYYPFNGDTPMNIFAGAFDGEKTIKVESGACPYGAFTGMSFAWVIQSGANQGKGNYFEAMSIANMVKYEEITGPTPEGQWYCPSVTDYWGEETYTDWTITIEKNGLGFTIKNFDQGFDAFLETQVAGLRSAAPVGIWDSTAKTLTISSETETGIAAGGVGLYWTGLANNDFCDIVLAFDFDNNTCTYTTALWGAYIPDTTEPGFYSLYNGPDMVFTKVTSSTTSVKSAPASSVAPARIAEDAVIGSGAKAASCTQVLQAKPVLAKVRKQIR